MGKGVLQEMLADTASLQESIPAPPKSDAQVSPGNELFNFAPAERSSAVDATSSKSSKLDLEIMTGSDMEQELQRREKASDVQLASERTKANAGDLFAVREHPICNDQARTPRQMLM